MNFYNRSNEQECINDCINKDVRIQIIYSKEGVGKSALIRKVVDKKENYYIDIYDDELILTDRAEAFTFLRNIAKAVEKTFSNFKYNKKFISQYLDKIDKSISVNVFFLNFTFNIPNNYDNLKQSLIKFLQKQEKNIYIHIEYMQKIDKESLDFLKTLVTTANNIFLLLEFSINENNSLHDFLENIETFSNQTRIACKHFEIKQLEWDYVRKILEDKNIYADDILQLKYNETCGNLKELFLSYEKDMSDNLDYDELFVITFIDITKITLTIQEIKCIFKCYQNNYYIINDFEKVVDKLIKKGVVGKNDFGGVYLRKRVITSQIQNMKNVNLIIEALSTYYMGIIQDESIDDISSKIKGLKILLPIFVKYEDERLENLLPYISKYFLPLNCNIDDIDYIFKAARNNNIKYYVLKLYMLMGEYKIIYDELHNCSKYSPFIRKILYLTALLHIEQNSDFIEETIINFIANEQNFKYKSAMYTCLITLYMKTKSSKYVLEYVNKLFTTEQIEALDKMIINKNISIYFDTEKAINMLESCIVYFRRYNYIRLEIATNITLATRLAQSGKIKNAKKILESIKGSPNLTIHDILYINNNLIVMEFYNNNKIIDINGLFDAYYSLNDEYTRLLACNNLLIYMTLSGNYESAIQYAKEIEDEGIEKYKFDEFLHLSYVNLCFFYTKFKDKVNEKKVDIYRGKLSNLKKDCDSQELKKYIDCILFDEKLSYNDKWFFMSQKKFRPAFMGHWLINNYDN